MNGRHFKTIGIPRAGLEYQDLIAIELLLTFFRDPDRYQWIEVESEDPSMGSLDDIVAARSDGSFELIQVKFTPDPVRYQLDWEWLLERTPRGSSRIAKWAESLRSAAGQGPIHRAQLRTNRRPSAALQEALSGHRIDLSRVDQKIRARVEADLGGPQSASDFFGTFEFSHSEPFIDDLEILLRGSIVPSDTDREGWLLLRDQVSRWAINRREPEPDGKIRYQHLVQTITKKRPRPIPQNFAIPAGYRVPRKEFHKDFLARIKDKKKSVSVLWGTPGRGKSTYLSFLISDLTSKKLPFVRHHYFLSLDDTTNDRMSFSEIASSLMDQVVSRYPDAVQGLEERPNQLRDWIDACGRYFGNEGKRFHVFVDGLDHVWREQANTVQMEHLFNHLLPCPPNVTLVVGTQRIPDTQLPARLLRTATSTDWIEIPGMDEGAVHHWVREQHDAGRVRLLENGNRRSVTQQLNSISEGFFDICGGHPLHLIYSFEFLVRRGIAFSADEIRQLPLCPDGDIVKYYNLLWGRLSQNAHQIVHLIAGSDFHWPLDGLRSCVGPIDEIAHLVEHRLTGIVPFHGSILAYVRERPDHAPTFTSLLPRVIEWLRSEARVYWRWGWLWLMQSKAGDDEPLLIGTTREWVVASLAAGYAHRQIAAILSAAEIKAFHRRDYSRTVELRSLKTRVLNGPEFQTNEFSAFSECAIASGGNTDRILIMADEIETLADDEVVILARLCARSNNRDLITRCLVELQRRVNLWITLRHKSGDKFVALARNYLEILASTDYVDLAITVPFIAKFRDSGGVFRWLLSQLLHGRRLELLLDLADYLRGAKREDWLLWTHDMIARVALIEGVNLATRLKKQDGAASSLMVCYFLKKGEPPPATVLGSLNGVILERYDYGRSVVLERFFQTVFFSALSTSLEAAGPFSLVLPGLDYEKMGWMSEAVRMLERAAGSMASGEKQPSFSLLYSEADAIVPVSADRPTDAPFAQYRSFKRALFQMCADIHHLTSTSGITARIDTEELARARNSIHWSDELWIDEQVESRVRILSDDAARYLFGETSRALARRVSVFHERADNWIQLGRFGLIYELPVTEEVVRRAANCLVGYGWRKDLWLNDVLEAIVDVHEHQAADTVPWIRSLVPIVEEITEFTDGDETDYIRSELIRSIADVCPERLPTVYARHIARDEWRYAHEGLRAFSRLISFVDPIAGALGRTFVESREIAILRERAEAGDLGAGQVEAAQLRYLGGSPIDVQDRPVTDSEPPETEEAPDITRCGPTEFTSLLDSISNYKVGYKKQRDALGAWLHHWKDRGSGAEALGAVWQYFETEENTSTADSMLDEAFLVALEVFGRTRAYDWLVLAHIHLRGWDSMWTSRRLSEILCSEPVG